MILGVSCDLALLAETIRNQATGSPAEVMFFHSIRTSGVPAGPGLYQGFEKGCLKRQPFLLCLKMNLDQYVLIEISISNRATVSLSVFFASTLTI